MTDVGPQFRFHETVVQLSSQSEGFVRFCQDTLSAHMVQESRNPDIEVRFLGINPRPLLGRRTDSALQPVSEGHVKVDTRIREDGGKYWYNDDSLSVLVSHRAEPPYMRIDGQYFERLDHTFRKLVNSGLRSNNFQQIMRRLVLGPVFMREELYHRVIPVHAGVVANRTRTVLLVGLSGVGKSTFALYIASQPGWDLIADNYALVSQSEVFGIREPVRLSEGSISMIGPGLSEVLRKGGPPYGDRTSYRIVGERDSGRITDIVFMRLGEVFAVERIDDDEMIALLCRLNNYLREFPQHDYLEMCYDYRSTHPSRRMELLRAFVSGKALHHITMSRRESLSLTFERFRDVLHLL